MSNGVVAWTFRSPSFVMTWMQKEPKRCPYVGLTLTRVDVDRPNYRSRLVAREIKKGMKKSDVPSAAEHFSGTPPLESVKFAYLSLGRLPQSGRGERQANSCDVRHQPCTLPWDTSATSIYLWSSLTTRRKGSHVKMYPIKNIFGLLKKCMALWMRLLVGRRITRRS